jgi:predicted PolB exonuclease-like 3'-5' exonuclease
MNLFVFDIETVPDTQAGRLLYNLHGLSDTEVAEAMFSLRRQTQAGSDFLPLHLQRIVAISVVLRTREQFQVWSLGGLDATEQELITRFYAGIDKYTPTLISWNGCGFDLPVIHYRALLHKVVAPRYWDIGDEDPGFRWNNYLNRFHYRHTDLMDILAGYQAKANAPLDQIASMLGFPGKMGMSGKHVWSAFARGELQAIRDYCETDVLNTYLVYLRFELMRGKLTEINYQAECSLVHDKLRQLDKPHLHEFIENWHERTTAAS